MTVKDRLESEYPNDYLMQKAIIEKQIKYHLSFLKKNKKKNF